MAKKQYTWSFDGQGSTLPGSGENLGTAIVPTSGGNGTAIVPTSGMPGAAILLSPVEGSTIPYSQGGTQWIFDDKFAIKNVSIGFNRESMTVTAECDIMGVEYHPGLLFDFYLYIDNELYDTHHRAYNKKYLQDIAGPDAGNGNDPWIHHTLTWECGKDQWVGTSNTKRFGVSFKDHGIQTMEFKIYQHDWLQTVTFYQDIHLDMTVFDRYFELRSPTEEYFDFFYFNGIPFFEFTLKDLPAKCKMTNPYVITTTGTEAGTAIVGAHDGADTVGYWIFFEDGTNHTDHSSETGEIKSGWIFDGLSMSEIGHPTNQFKDYTNTFWRRAAFYRLEANVDWIDWFAQWGTHNFSFELGLDNI